MRAILIILLIASASLGRPAQAPLPPQGPPVRSVCDCSECGPGCNCRFPGECSAHWRKSPNDQYGLFVGDRQVGVWNGEGYYPIVGGQWGKKCKTPPVPLPKPEISRLPRPQVYIPPRVLGGELVPLSHHPIPAAYIQPMYQPQYQTFAPTYVGGSCSGGT